MSSGIDVELDGEARRLGEADDEFLVLIFWNLGWPRVDRLVAD